MLDALKAYLEALGYSGIAIDTLPDVQKQRDVIALFEWNHALSDINDGTGLHYIQVQVRRSTYTAARKICRKLFTLLDSGTEERLLYLTDNVFCIARPRRGPIKMESGTNYVTFYYELALWGTN